MAAVSLLLGVLAVVGLVWVWQLAIRARSWVVPSLVTIPVAFYAWARVTSVFDGLLIRAADGELFCRQSRSWPRIQAKVAIADIAQVFTAQTGRTYSLFARLRSGKAKLLVRNMSNPRLAVYFESQIERALGIEDRPDEKELPRNAPLPRPTSRSRMILMELGMLSLFLLAPAVGLSACTPLVELEVADTPTEKPFALKKHALVTFTSEIELTDNKWRYRSEIPRSFTFEIQILRDGQEVTALSCDPFDLSVWTSSSSNKQVSSFWGPMSHCSAELDSGHYTLRAVRRWKPGAERIGLDESNLGLRD
jgi:hypothetical protein